MKRLPLILSFVLFVALCASTSFWVLQFIKPETRKVTAAPVNKPIADVESVAGLFGGAMAVNTNYQLKGVVLANPENQSGAIIAVDGKPTQAYRMDAEIVPGVKLTEVHAGYIVLQDNGVSKRVDLPQDFKSSGQIASVNDNAVPAPRAPRMRIPSPDNAASPPAQTDNGPVAMRNRMHAMRNIPARVPKNVGDAPDQLNNNAGGNTPDATPPGQQ